MAALEPNLLEEGVTIHVAERLVAGQHLYRDIVFFTGPFPFELLAFLFRMFGESILVARTAVVVLHGITSAAAFDLAQRARIGTAAHLAAAFIALSPVLLFPLCSIYFYTTLAMSLILLAVYAAERGTQSTGWACAAGVLTACVALSKQTVGVTLGLGLLLTFPFVTTRKRRGPAIRGLLFGGTAVALIGILAFALTGTLHDMVGALVVTPLSLNDSFRMPFPSLWPPFVLDQNTLTNLPYYLPGLYVLLFHSLSLSPALIFATQLLYAAPVAVLLATLAQGATRRLPPAVWLSGVGLLTASTNLLPRTDFGHLAMALPATAFQLVLVAALGNPRESRLWRPLVAGGVAALLSAGIIAGAQLYKSSGPPTFGPRVPLRPVNDVYRAPAVSRVISYLRTHARPGEEIFVARQEPLLYFATDTQNPTRYEGMVQGLRGEQEEEILRVLPRLRYIVMSESDAPERGFYSQELPAVYAALERYFRVPDDFPLDEKQWILVLERGPDRGPSAIDLIADRVARSPWIRDHPQQVRRVDPAVLPTVRPQGFRRPLLTPMGQSGGGIDLSLEVPRNGVFQAAVGLGTLETSFGTLRQGAGVRFSVSVVSGLNEVVIQSLELPADRSGKRHWQPFEADLSAYAGQHIILRLEAVPIDPTSHRGFADRGFAWWGSPRIAAASQGPNA
jgi:hypothetical protein